MFDKRVKHPVRFNLVVHDGSVQQYLHTLVTLLGIFAWSWNFDNHTKHGKRWQYGDLGKL